MMLCPILVCFERNLLHSLAPRSWQDSRRRIFSSHACPTEESFVLAWLLQVGHLNASLLVTIFRFCISLAIHRTPYFFRVPDSRLAAKVAGTRLTWRFAQTLAMNR